MNASRSGLRLPVVQLRLGVGAIIRNSEGAVLVGRRHGGDHIGQIELIGGLVEADEDPIDALLREVAEEAGSDLKIRVLELAGINTWYKPADDGAGRIKTTGLSFLCQHLGGKARVVTEHGSRVREHIWLYPGVLLRRNDLTPMTRLQLRQLLHRAPLSVTFDNS